MADSKQDEGFKVVDRRLFTEQGELRKEVVEQERRDEELAAKKAVAAPATNAQQKKPTPPEGGVLIAPEESSHKSDEAPAELGADQQPSRSFQMLVDFLTRNAAAMLGGMADPRTGQAFLDLEGAREMIDMLDTLREKTRGNLATIDEELLVEVLGSLKLTYMEVAKAATEQMNKKAGVKQ